MEDTVGASRIARIASGKGQEGAHKPPSRAFLTLKRRVRLVRNSYIQNI